MAVYSEEEQRKILASNLQYQIEISGKDQRKICADLEINPPTFNQWANGKAIPNISTLRRLMKYFNCTMSALIDPLDVSVFSDALTPKEKNLIIKYRTASSAIKEAVDKLLN